MYFVNTRDLIILEEREDMVRRLLMSGLDLSDEKMAYFANVSLEDVEEVRELIRKEQERAKQ
jgi:hypothetical protein